VLAGVVVGALIPILAYDTRVIGGVTVEELNGTKFTVIAGVFSILAILAYLACYYLTEERVIPEQNDRKLPSALSLVTSSLKNRALISIIVASVIMLLSQFTFQQLANYIYPDYYSNTAAQSVSTIVMLAGMLVAAIGAKPLANKFGKAEISAASNILAAATLLFLFFFRPESVWVYVGLSAFAWLGLGVFTMVSWALITDVIDDAELRRGIREDVSIYSLYSFSRKMGQAAAAGVTGLLLTLIGYEKMPGTPLAESVKSGLYSLSTLIPAIGFIILAAVLWFWYPLHKKRVSQNVALLKEKHGD
jgi:GPH family glycoside/pentoside/hexuronide:cation symporter